MAQTKPNTFCSPARQFLIGLFIALNGAGCDISNNDGSIKLRDGDPAVVDFPVAYVHRPLPVDGSGNAEAIALLNPAAFHPGAQLIVKERASPSAHEYVLTGEIFANTEGDIPAQYDVKDLSVSADGSKLLFSLRAPTNDDEQPTWDIWQYDPGAAEKSDRLRPLMSAELASRGHDVSPQYLPNGRVVFSSNRQTRTRAILNDENKPQYPGLDDKRREEAFVLHVWYKDALGNEQIEQITYNVSQDLQPTVLDDGRLLFLRRDGINQHDKISLYTTNVDGSDLQPYYGYHSQHTGTNESPATFVRPRVLPDGRILAILRARDSARLGGDIIAIDGANYIDINHAINAGSGTSGHESLTGGKVDTTGAASTAGTYNSAYPFYDGTGRLLVSWSPCRLIGEAGGQIRPCADNEPSAPVEPAAPLYGLWMYNPSNDTQLPIKIPEEGYMLTDAVVMAPAPRPSPWQPVEVDADLKEEGTATVHIRSVYDIDGVDMAPGGVSTVADPAQIPTDSRPVRFLRIVKNVPIPNDNVLEFSNSIFGRSAAQGMRDIVGYVPVEPDGSALFKVPADIPFMFDLLDAQGKRIGPRHENWLHLRPGEHRECTGCHTRNSTLPHGRRDAEIETINPGATGGMPFANTRLLDRFGTAQPNPQFGESMAQYYARISGPRAPVADIVFTDEWTDPLAAAPGVDIRLRYSDITANANPADSDCSPRVTPTIPWHDPELCTANDTRCRTTIHYLKSIAPLWQADRRSCDEFGEVIADNTCTSCHTRTRDGLLQVPAAQLELTNEMSLDRNAFVTSYVELLFEDNAQELEQGMLVDILVANDTGEYETNAGGEMVLDAIGQPIPIIEYSFTPVPAVMSTDGARASNRFFSRFDASGSHAGWLSAAELKLIAEWLDIGAQYYNDPFVAPAD